MFGGVNRRRWVLGAVVLAVLAIGLDGTILSVALPTLADDLHASTVDLQWFVAAYTLVLAAVLLPGGLIGDRFGRRKLLLAALAVFGLGSLACAYAPSPGWFVAARVVSGVGAAVTAPLSLSVLTVVFPAEERPRAVAVYAASTFLALPVGPILGGWMLAHLWWGWVFLVNLPVVALGIAAVALLVPESRSGRRPGLDPVGVLASSSGLAGLTFGVIHAGQYGWTDPLALSAITAGVSVLVGFLRWERRLARRPGGDPLVDPRLFSSASFTWGTVLAAVAGLAMIGVLFTAPQFFQAVLGADAMGSGLRLLPMMGGLALGAGSADRISARAGAKATTALGFALLAVGLGTGATTGVDSGEGFLAAWLAVVGLGMGLALATGTSAALGVLSDERSGVGSAVVQTVQKVGAPLGTAVLGSVLNSAYQDRLDVAGLPAPAVAAARESVFAALAAAQGSPRLLGGVRAAFVHGMDVMLWTCGAVAVTGLVLTLALLPHRTTVAAGQRVTDETEPERESVRASRQPRRRAAGR